MSNCIILPPSYSSRSALSVPLPFVTSVFRQFSVFPFELSSISIVPFFLSHYAWCHFLKAMTVLFIGRVTGISNIAVAIHLLILPYNTLSLISLVLTIVSLPLWVSPVIPTWFAKFVADPCATLRSAVELLSRGLGSWCIWIFMSFLKYR